MAYPFIPESWTEPVNQNLYASVVFLIVQIGLGLIQTLLKRYWTVPSKVVSGLGWMTLTVPPVAIASISIIQGVVSRWMPAIFLLSLLPAVVVSIRGLNQLRMLRAAGVHGAIREPNIASYQDFLGIRIKRWTEWDDSDRFEPVDSGLLGGHRVLLKVFVFHD